MQSSASEPIYVFPCLRFSTLSVVYKTTTKKTRTHLILTLQPTWSQVTTQEGSLAKMIGIGCFAFLHRLSPLIVPAAVSIDSHEGKFLLNRRRLRFLNFLLLLLLLLLLQCNAMILLPDLTIYLCYSQKFTRMTMPGGGEEHRLTTDS
jgi:hypothetical protein